VLDLAKIEAGGFELRESDVDLARLIDDAAALMAPRAQSGGCVLETAVAPSLPLAHADERALKQIVLNLLSNAIKFTPGGAVEIFAHAEPKGGLVFGVADNGIGIAREDQARIFENFGQGRHDVAINDKGTGLGLPIALGLVRAHGGRIALESELGRGTRVSVHLPVSRTRVKLKAAS
jgi:signal transduction histidine kinase